MHEKIRARKHAIEAERILRLTAELQTLIIELDAAHEKAAVTLLPAVTLCNRLHHRFSHGNASTLDYLEVLSELQRILTRLVLASQQIMDSATTLRSQGPRQQS